MSGERAFVFDRTTLAGVFGAILIAAVASGCGSSPTQVNDPEVIRACRESGSPVTVGQLIDVLRRHGIRLAVATESCMDSGVARITATNHGDPQSEGTVLCHTGFPAGLPRVNVAKDPSDVETGIDVLNVLCTVYPTSKAEEAQQVTRLRTALKSVLDQAPR